MLNLTTITSQYQHLRVGQSGLRIKDSAPQQLCLLIAKTPLSELRDA